MTTILVPFHLDERIELDWPLPAAQTIAATPSGDEPWARLAALYGPVADAVAWSVGRGEVPVVLSGDCTTSLGTVAGLQRAGVDPGIVWFDAHGDVQTVETTTSGYLGGMPLRILVGYRPELISTALGLRPTPEERVVLVDARDLDPPEATYLASAAIRHLPVVELTAATAPDGPLYLHLDLDVIDPTELPGLLFPAPGGPAVESVAAAAARVVDTGRVVAIGLACTWRPGHGAAERLRPWLTSMLGGAA